MEISKDQFRFLIYSKNYSAKLTHQLLGIADSAMADTLLIEDLLDLITELVE